MTQSGSSVWALTHFVDELFSVLNSIFEVNSSSLHAITQLETKEIMTFLYILKTFYMNKFYI